jgi:thiamine pyrophosphate-dependent acetolactate synthase large subunit-like protein
MFIGRVSRRQDDWERRVQLAEALGAKVVTDLRAGASFPTDHPLHGPVPRPNLPPASQELFRQADVILALDAVDLAGALQLAKSGGPCAAKIIHCSVDSYVHNGWSMDHQALPPVDIRVLADPDAAVAALLPAVVAAGAKPAATWDGKARTLKTQPVPPQLDAGPISYAQLTHCLAKVRARRETTIVRVGLGWASEHYPFRDPLDFLGWDGGGGLEAGPSMAVGAALALAGTKRIALTLVGDSDFLQGATALWTASHYRLPALIIVTNNHSNYNDEIHQEQVARERHRPVENKWIGMRMDDPQLDLVQLANAQGVEAAGPIDNAADLMAAIDRAFEVVGAGRPYLLDVIVTPSGGPLLKRA